MCVCAACVCRARSQSSSTSVKRGKDMTGAGVGEQGKYDMGYYMTARMILEGGIQLARHGEESEASGCAKGGVLTPATAMGLPLIARLEQAGFQFAIEG